MALRRPAEAEQTGGSVPTKSWTMGSGNVGRAAVPSAAMMMSRTAMAVALPV